MANHDEFDEPASSDGAPKNDPAGDAGASDDTAQRVVPEPRSPWSATRVATRPCAWCAKAVVVEKRPGRPRLYCKQACRQRAFEHRHGFRHERTVTALPGQARGERWGGTGYERGIVSYLRGKAHALRTSVRPEGSRRETLCGVLAMPAPVGRHFSPLDRRACRSCSRIALATPLTLGINPSNELARLRALIEETAEHRLEPRAAVAWLQQYAPESPPPPPPEAAAA